MPSDNDADKMPFPDFSLERFSPEMVRAMMDKAWAEMEPEILAELLSPEAIPHSPFDIAVMQAFDDAVKRRDDKQPEAVPPLCPLAKAIFEKMPSPRKPQ